MFRLSGAGIPVAEIVKAALVNSGMSLVCDKARAVCNRQCISKVLFDDGKIQIFRDGKNVGSCSIAEFSRHPNAAFRQLQRYAAGG